MTKVKKHNRKNSSGKVSNVKKHLRNVGKSKVKSVKNSESINDITNNQKQKAKQEFFNAIDNSPATAEDIKDALRSMRTAGALTDKQYDSINDNWDNWLNEYEIKEKFFKTFPIAREQVRNSYTDGDNESFLIKGIFKDMNSNGTITDSEYSLVKDNWDEWLGEYYDKDNPFAKDKKEKDAELQYKADGKKLLPDGIHYEYKYNEGTATGVGLRNDVPIKELLKDESNQTWLTYSKGINSFDKNFDETNSHFGTNANKELTTSFTTEWTVDKNNKQWHKLNKDADWNSIERFHNASDLDKNKILSKYGIHNNNKEKIDIFYQNLQSGQNVSLTYWNENVDVNKNLEYYQRKISRISLAMKFYNDLIDGKIKIH